VDGIPSHGGSLLGVRGVVSRLVQDRDANVPIWVHVGMPDRRCKCHLGRSVGVVLRELELAIENASLTVLQKTSLPPWPAASLPHPYVVRLILRIPPRRRVCNIPSLC
jgi:hypothetical protein